MTDLQKKAEEIYRKMTSYANYSEMNGISKKWFLQKIKQGLQEYHQSELLKLNKSDVKFSISELSEMILKHKAKSEYKQASIVILRNIFEENGI